MHQIMLNMHGHLRRHIKHSKTSPDRISCGHFLVERFINDRVIMIFSSKTKALDSYQLFKRFKNHCIKTDEQIKASK